MYKGKTAFEDANTLFKESGAGASGVLDFTFTGPSGTFHTAEGLAIIQEVEGSLRKAWLSRHVFSIADAIALSVGKHESFLEGQPLIDQDIQAGLALLEMSEFPHFKKSEFINEDGSKLRVTEFINFGDISPQVFEKERVDDAVIQKHLPGHITYSRAGRPMLWAHMVHYVIESQIVSFCLAFVLIAIIMSLVFRSIRIGLLSLIPNITPIVVVIGVLGWTGILFNSFIALFACVALGVVVDDTIHFTTHFQKKCKEGLEPKEAVIKTFEYVGFPMLITSGILALGLSVFWFSSMTTSTKFGLCVASACLLALLADLFILPPLLLLYSKRKMRT